MLSSIRIQWWARIIGGVIVLAGVINLVLAPLIGDEVFTTLWGVEPFAYIGAVLVIAGLSVISLSPFVPRTWADRNASHDTDGATAQRWSQLTQHYFELFHHDLGRPLGRILGKERELRAILQASEAPIDLPIQGLLDEIEQQAPSFRLMISNIQVLVQLEAPSTQAPLHPVEPSEVVRKIVDRYTTVAADAQKELTWWAEPAEFGIVYSDGSAIEHVVTNLADNAVRFASRHVEIKLTKNPSHFFVRVWDDGPGIAPQYLQHIFDRGWTPEVARGEEKPSSGLGLFIARTLANRYGGELTVESVPLPDSDHHTAFLLSLPFGQPEVTLS